MPQRVVKSFLRQYSEWDQGTKARFYVGVFVIIMSICVMIVVIRSVKKIEYDTSKAEYWKEQAEYSRRNVAILVEQVKGIAGELAANKTRDSAAIARAADAIQRITHIDAVIQKINNEHEKQTDFDSYTDGELSMYISTEAERIRAEGRPTNNP